MGEFLNIHKKTFIAIVVGLLVVISIIIYRVMTNSIFNYAEIEKKTIETIINQTSEYTEEDRMLSKQLSQEKSKQSWVLSGNVKINEFSQTSMLLRGLLANSRMVMESVHDPKANEMSGEVRLQLQRTNLLKADVYQNNLYSAIKLPFDSRPIGIKNERFGEWMATQHDRDVVSELPRPFNQSFDLSILDYVKMIKLLHDTEISKQSNVSFKDGVYQKVTMNVSPSQTQELLQLFIRELKKYNNSYSQNLVEYLNDVTFPKGFTFEAYYTEEAVKYREVKGYYTYKGHETDFNLDLETKLNDNDYQVEMDLEVNRENQPLKIYYQAIGQPKKDDYKVSRTLSIDGQQKLDLDWDTLYSEQEKEIEFDLDLPFIFKRVEGNVDVKTNINNDSGVRTYNGQLFINNVRTNFKLTRDIEFMEEISVSSIDPQDIRFIDQMSISEYQKWFELFERNVKSYINQIINQINPF